MLLFFFFLSGFSALVYQVLWMRLLALVFGVTIHAASTVLAAFMAGLALGSAAAGRVADRVRRPLVARRHLRRQRGRSGRWLALDGILTAAGNRQPR